MKYDANSYSDVDVLTTVEEKDITLSKHAQTIIFQMFSKNIYSNPIGTVVREITSNCFDSHIEANVNLPIIIRKTTDKQTNSTYISFIDFGVGMSPERIDNVFSVMFESTKTLSNLFIGCYGLGSKSPLAYKRSCGYGQGEYDNSYFIITIFNNIKYTYQIYEGNNCPKISLLYQEKTSEHNGTEVRIPVLDKDLESFSKEMIRQLYYFENIIFEGFKDVWKYGETLTNHYQIVKGKTFFFRGTDYSNTMHVCLGRVAYPIDYNILGLSSSEYNLPVAVKLEVGEIGITVSRESLDYSESTIKILKKKLIETKAEITAMISKQYEKIVTLEDYFNVKNDFGQLKFNAKMSMYVGNLIKQADIDFSNFKYNLNFLKMPNDRQLFKLFFNVKTCGKKPKRSRYSNRYEFDGGYTELKSKDNLLYITGEFERKNVRQSYLKSLYDQYYIISKRSLTDFSIKADISELFNVHLGDLLDSNGKAIPYVQALIEMQEEYFSIVQKHASDYDLVIIPEDFIIERKKRDVLSPEIRKSTIPIKFMGGNKYRVIIDNLLKYEMPIFYGTQEDERKLSNAFDLYHLLFNNKIIVNCFWDNDFKRICENRYNYYGSKKKDEIKGSIMFIMLASNNIKYMKYCKNAIHIDNFYLKMAYRKENVVKQYFQVYNLIEKYNNLSTLYIDKNFGKLNIQWGNKINKVNAFIEAIPDTAKDKDINNKRSLVEGYFGSMSNIPMSKDQQKIMKIIDEIKDLEIRNKEYLKYIDNLYGLDKANSILIDILKKIMIF